MGTQTVIRTSREILRHYESYRAGVFTQRRFSPETLYKTLDETVNNTASVCSMCMPGRSFEGRPINMVCAGTGKIRVLLWSQMHGDESTATMAIVDILNYISKDRDENPVKQILSELTLWFIPMLNPDGAFRFQRRTAQGIDMNRDALALCTPEAKLLKQLRDEIAPEFGFNLHDQELSTVGTSKELAAMGLLAPAFNPDKSDNEVRLRAKHLASCFAAVMKEYIPGKVTRYDDAFEPRAFGDNMQKWGTSTLLIESGHALNDPEKSSIRKLNVAGILTCCHAIASGGYRSFGRSAYEDLPPNGKKAYDVIIRNVLIEHPGGERTASDIAVSYQVDTHSESTPLLVDVGDLHTFTGVEEVEGKAKHILQSMLQIGKPFRWEELF